MLVDGAFIHGIHLRDLRFAAGLNDVVLYLDKRSYITPCQENIGSLAGHRTGDCSRQGYPPSVNDGIIIL